MKYFTTLTGMYNVNTYGPWTFHLAVELMRHVTQLKISLVPQFHQLVVPLLSMFTV